MRGNKRLNFFLVIAIIAALVYIAAAGDFFGIHIKSAWDIRPGIDIKGGIDAQLYAVTEAGQKPPTQDDLDSVENVINKRLDNLAIFDREVSTDVNNGCVIIRIPWKADEKNFDPDAAIKEIGKTALLTFQEVDENLRDEKTNQYKPTGKIIIQGTDVEDAKPQVDQQNGGMLVELKLSDEAKKKFSEATGRLVNKPIAIFMDDIYISAPIVSTQITDGNAVITLGNSEDPVKEARELAETIRSGSLPFRLEARQVNSITPLLGKGALDVMVRAFIVAFILTCLYMICYYRLPGFLACIALVGHTTLSLLILSWLGITVTLPGIAGIILSLGMAVDGNVIIFERIKEELKTGKTLKAAIDLGFKRAFAAIFDGNMTTLISAIVLFIFGTGSIKSFAYTLGIGVALSFLFAVTVTRILMEFVADVAHFKSHWLYGVKEVKA